MDRTQLIAAIEAGEEPDFLFFWGHQPSKDGSITSSCLSQWWPCSFTIAGVRYPSAEHFMMAAKARLFLDDEALGKILADPDPRAAKATGREVRNFDAAAWEQARVPVVVEGNLAKFGQNRELRDFLLSTGEHVIVEASPRDRIWGIGLGAGHPDARDPRRWRGQNLLGFALMEVRQRLSRG